MLDQTLDYRTATVTPTPTSHRRYCAECQNAVRHSHRVGEGVWHITGTSEIHEVTLAEPPAVPTCTCVNGYHASMSGHAPMCYHLKSAETREREYQEGLAALGDEYSTLEAGDGPVYGDSCCACMDTEFIKFNGCQCACHSVVPVPPPVKRGTLESLFEDYA